MTPAMTLAARSWTRRLVWIVLATSTLAGAPNAQTPEGGSIHRVRNAVRGRYIVGVRRNADPESTALMAERVGRGRVHHVFRAASHGFAIEASETAARALASDPAVAYVEEDARVRLAVDEERLGPDDNWGLDRIDQRSISSFGYDQTYRYSDEGTGVNVYVVDTGIRTTHVEFGGRANDAFNARPGDPYNSGDCNGHGTHVAGIVGGARFGVAKAVMLHSVRVIGCDGTGLLSDLIAGIDWIAANRALPAVINMSIQSEASEAFNESARGAVAAGIVFVAAAGNDNADSCGGLVGGDADLVVAAASDSADIRAPFSNYGRCVDLFAPGVDIRSAYADSDTSTARLSGTSMASPHVAGAAALYLQAHRTATAAQVTAAIITTTTKGVIANQGNGSPRRLLFTPSFGDTTPPAISIVEPRAGATVRGVQTIQLTVQDDVELASVTALACGSQLGIDASALHSVQWNTRASKDGACVLEVRAQDTAGNVATARRTVIVNNQDVTPPSLTLSAPARRIWPPNGKLVPITFTGTVSDNVSRITAVSFRVVDEYGRVQPSGTAAVSGGRFTITVYLEAQRTGSDTDGRKYTIRVNATDAAGNRTLATAVAIVPHDNAS